MSHATSILPAFALNDLPPAQKAAVSFLARYQDPTLALYKRYLGVWFTWCQDNGLDPLEVDRGHLEIWVHEFAKTHKASTVGSAFTPIRGFYSFADYDGVITRNPAAHVRLPKIIYPKKKPVDRYDIRKFLAAAKDTSPRHWALTQLLGVMGLRVSEACSLTVEQARNVEQGMRVLNYIGKGSKPATTPIPYQSILAIDAVIDGRTTGWLIPTRAGHRLSRHAATGLIDTVNRRAGIDIRMNHEDSRTTKRHYDLTQTELGSHPVHAIGARLAV